jgi:hypothetical protein
VSPLMTLGMWHRVVWETGRATKMSEGRAVSIFKVEEALCRYSGIRAEHF